MKKRYSIQNEYGAIESLLIKKAADAFRSDRHIQQEWQALHFTEAPYLQVAIEQYNAFEKLLSDHVSAIYHLPASENVNLDSLYCRDACILTDHGVILCAMGKELRRNEPNEIKSFCDKHAIPIIGTIESPGTIEGGDIAWIDESTLAVGHTYRTNKEGIDQLKKILLPFDIEIVEVPLPHYKGAQDVFHLMSIFSPIDRDIAVVYSPLMPISFRNYLLDRAWHLIAVPEQEFETMGCNVLALKPRTVLLVEGNPLTADALKKAGCLVFTYEGTEISVKGGGGPTCLTRPLQRSLADTGFGG